MAYYGHSLIFGSIFLLQEFAAASCYEIHPFEVAKWIGIHLVLELLFHLWKVLLCFRHQITVRFHLPPLDRDLRENEDLVVIPRPQKSACMFDTFVEWMNEWMRERAAVQGRNITFLICTAPPSFRFQLCPVPSWVPVMDWRRGGDAHLQAWVSSACFIATTMGPV